MKIYTLLFVSLFFSFNSNAQLNSCDGDRYLNHQFDNVDITTDIQYGEAVTLGGVTQQLIMDVYTPVGDIVEDRPMIIFAHGGGFIGGTKEDMEVICTDFALRGFVTASISYRLLDVIVFDSIAFTEEMVLAISDMKAAVRYFKESANNDNEFDIDPNNIFVGGISAGAVMACNVGILDDDDVLPDYIDDQMNNHGGFEGESSDNSDQYNSSVRGIINYSGGIARIDWVDSGDPVIFSKHDELDGVVPCSYATSDLFFFPLYSYGSCDIISQADLVGIYNDSNILLGNDGHVSYFGDLSDAQVTLNETASFLYDVLCDNVGVEELTDNNLNTIFPNPSNGLVKFNLDKNKQYSISVYDLQGKLVLDGIKIIDSSVDFRQSDIQNGTYLLKIYSTKSSEVAFSEIHIIK